MAAIRIEIDGSHLVSVNLEGMQLLHVSVSSSLHEEAAATLEVHGGTYSEGVDGHRIWVTDKPLLPGQSVKVSFTESAGPFDQGKTMRELFPDNEPGEEYDFTMTDSRATELRARPQHRESFAMRVAKNSETGYLVESDPKNDQFTFMILWEQSRPLCARLSVRTYCFEDVIARQVGNDHLRSTLELEESATCRLA